MTSGATRDARRALARLRRAVKKSERELDDLQASIRRAEGSDFPEEEYERVRRRLDEIALFAEEEAERLQRKVLEKGGLEPGRIRRSSGS